MPSDSGKWMASIATACTVNLLYFTGSPAQNFGTEAKYNRAPVPSAAFNMVSQHASMLRAAIFNLNLAADFHLQRTLSTTLIGELNNLKLDPTPGIIHVFFVTGYRYDVGGSFLDSFAYLGSGTSFESAMVSALQRPGAPGTSPSLDAAPAGARRAASYVVARVQDGAFEIGISSMTQQYFEDLLRRAATDSFPDGDEPEEGRLPVQWKQFSQTHAKPQRLKVTTDLPGIRDIDFGLRVSSATASPAGLKLDVIASTANLIAVTTRQRVAALFRQARAMDRAAARTGAVAQGLALAAAVVDVANIVHSEVNLPDASQSMASTKMSASESAPRVGSTPPLNLNFIMFYTPPIETSPRSSAARWEIDVIGPRR